MSNILHTVEAEMPALLEDESSWQSLLIDYHPPVVYRLWRQWGDYRIYQHCIFPCTPEQALFHPHPWPSWMRVWGTYKMGIGFGAGDTPPPVAATVTLNPGDEYEMVHIDGWHSVQPLFVPSYSLMVTGKPWDRSSPKSEGPLGPLSPEHRARLFGKFRSFYPV